MNSSIHQFTKGLLVLLVLCVGAKHSFSSAHNYDFVETVERVSSSVVAIGLYSPLKQSGSQMRGTGFVVDNGQWVITNHHVVDEVLDPTVVEHYVVLHGQGKDVKTLKATIEAIDPQHDLALLRIQETLPSTVLANSELLPVGSEIAITGYPLGAVLGLYASTHRGYIASVSPDALPTAQTQGLTVDMLARLENPDLIYQLDATAYPGNSGSPIYRPDSGEVIGVINKVFIVAGKESAISTPTGISYAIPIAHVHKLLSRAKGTH